MRMRRPAADLLLVACASLLAVATLVAAGWQTRPSEQQVIVRLLEQALEPDSHFSWSAEPIAPAVDVAQRWRFDEGTKGWLLLDEATHLADDTSAAVAAWAPRTIAADDPTDGRVLRFPTAHGTIARLLPLPAQRFVRLVATARRAPPLAAPPPAQAPREARLFVQPLLKSIDLASELTKRSYVEIAVDPKLRAADDPLWGGGVTPPTGRLEETSVTFVTPAGTQAIAIFFAAGDGSAAAPLDLLEIRLEEVTLREAIGLGITVSPSTPTALLVPFHPLELGVADPPDPLRPALRKVEDLLERRNALLLPPPATASFEVDLPDGDLVLEYGVTRVHESRKPWSWQPIDCSVRIEPVAGGEAITQEQMLLRDGATGWCDRTLSLAALAGQRVRITWSTTAKVATADVVAIGAPLVRRRAARDTRPNVVLISLDTVRADHWSCHGYPRPTTPNLDALARESAWFRDVSSTASYTLPAHGSMLTGQLPSRHGALSESPGRNRLSTARSDLLAVRLRDAGWQTAAFAGGVYVRASFGFDQGFDRFDTSDLALPAAAPRARELPCPGDPWFNARHHAAWNWQRGLDWIRAHADGRFFLFLHTYLVHEYLAAPDHEARFEGSDASTLARGDLKFIRDRTLTVAPTPADLDHYVDAYDAALHEADARIGELVATLREQGLLDSTILVVTSDHGEEFLEHGGVNHGRTLFEEMVRVPLVVRVPGLAPLEIGAPVSLVDVTPTLFELCGIVPRYAADGGSLLDGRSLVPLLRGGAATDVPIEAELDLVCENRWTLHRFGGSKALDARDDRSEKRIAKDGRPRGVTRRMVFGVGVDPRETRDQCRGAPDEESAAAELLDELDLQRGEWRQRRAAALQSPRFAISSSDRRDLEQLGGYLEHDNLDDGCGE